MEIGQTIIGILKNPWTVTIVGGVIVLGIGYWFFSPKENNKNHKSARNRQNQSVNQTVIVNGNDTSTRASDTQNKDGSSAMKIVGYKKAVKILFIDNESLKDKIRGLNNAGWENVSQMRDVENIDSPPIRDANIIFVDYKGIGGKEKEQGLAVITALKARYGEEKWLILFTAYNVPVTAFEKGANDYLAKNSGTYETEQKIIKGLQKLQQ